MTFLVLNSLCAAFQKPTTWAYLGALHSSSHPRSSRADLCPCLHLRQVDLTTWDYALLGAVFQAVVAHWIQLLAVPASLSQEPPLYNLFPVWRSGRAGGRAGGGRATAPAHSAAWRQRCPTAGLPGWPP